MKQIKNKFMNITLRSKMILSYIMIALIPFIMFAVISMAIFVNREQRNVSEHTNQILEQVNTALDVYINSIEKISNYIIREVEGYSFFESNTGNDIFFNAESSKIENLLYDFTKTHTEIAGILIATEHDLYVSTGMQRVSRDPFNQEEWYVTAVNNPNEIQIHSNMVGRNIVTDESYVADNVFSLSKVIVHPDTGETIGVILMDIRHDIIYQSTQSITIGEKGFIFVMDNDQHMVYTPENEVAYRVNPKWISSDGSNYQTRRIKGETYQIRHIKSQYTGWNIVGVFSLDEIMSTMNSMIYILISSLVIVILFLVFISLKIAMTITQPIIQLRKNMKTAESGDLTVRFQAEYKDEVSELGRSFNHMLVRIEELLQLVYTEQKNKRNAELKVLQEQIKPHFLYNTLDTISWMAREYEADEIVRLVDALTTMFRIGLSKGKDYITIEKEIAYISNYLHIQKIRYRSKLNYRIIDDTDLWGYEVPKLILQPLVENAIYHGIKATGKEGHIIITVEQHGEQEILLAVADDGIGMTAEKEAELNHLLNKPTELEENQSFGLFYIKERLRLRYGENFTVQVTSAEGQGTKVTIIIPKR